LGQPIPHGSHPLAHTLPLGHLPWASLCPTAPILVPPIAPWPSPMGNPIPNKPPSAGLACTPCLPSLGPPITPWPSPIFSVAAASSCHFLSHPFHHRSLCM
ncbi:hypothetical protein PAXRUDRAFT_176871, partial [Paxillus rubicundulus Ve08.2h10]